MIRDSRKTYDKKASRRRGFTLVEMMVATALVVVMMLMFAQVFQTAGGLVSNQKGLAENDQSERTLTILLRGDVAQRTFRDVVPLSARRRHDELSNRCCSAERDFSASPRTIRTTPPTMCCI